MIASSRVRLQKTPAAMVFGMPRIVQSVSRKEANPRGTSVSPVSPEKPLDVSDDSPTTIWPTSLPTPLRMRGLSYRLDISLSSTRLDFIQTVLTDGERKYA